MQVLDCLGSAPALVGCPTGSLLHCLDRKGSIAQKQERIQLPLPSKKLGRGKGLHRLCKNLIKYHMITATDWPFSNLITTDNDWFLFNSNLTKINYNYIKVLNNLLDSLKTFKVAEADLSPTSFTALQVYVPPSDSVTMEILRELFERTFIVPKCGDCRVNMEPLGVVHSTWGVGFPSIKQVNWTGECSSTTLFEGVLVIRG